MNLFIESLVIFNLMAEDSSQLPVDDSTFLSYTNSCVNIVPCSHNTSNGGLIKLGNSLLSNWLKLIIHNNNANKLKSFFDFNLIPLQIHGLFQTGRFLQLNSLCGIRKHPVPLGLVFLDLLHVVKRQGLGATELRDRQWVAFHVGSELLVLLVHA